MNVEMKRDAERSILNREETIAQYNAFIQKTHGKSKHYKLREAADSWSDDELANFVREHGFEPVYSN